VWNAAARDSLSFRREYQTMHQLQLLAFQILGQMEAFPEEDFAEPVQQMSYLSWVYNALGPMYGLLLPLLGLVAFIGACLVVARNRRPADIAAGVYFAAAPFILGVFGVVHGMIATFQVIAASGTTPKPSDLALGISTSLFAAMFGLLCSFPSYAVLAIGYLVRSLTGGGDAGSGKGHG
jgi:hypothetical protein